MSPTPIYKQVNFNSKTSSDLIALIMYQKFVIYQYIIKIQCKTFKSQDTDNREK